MVIGFTLPIMEACEGLECLSPASTQSMEAPNVSDTLRTEQRAFVFNGLVLVKFVVRPIYLDLGREISLRVLNREWLPVRAGT